jgi:hypothetical protein
MSWLTNIAERSPAPRPAPDLNLSAGETARIRWVLEAQQHPPVEGLLQAYVVGEGGIPPQILLGLLTYCYAVGLYGSVEIAAAISEQPALKYLCTTFRPAHNTLRRFRRNHREMLRQSLALVLHRGWREASSADAHSGGLGQAGWRRQPPSLAPGPAFGAGRSPIEMCLFLAESENRLLTAAQLDCMALDD